MKPQKQKRPDPYAGLYGKLVQDGLVAGMSRREAEGHAEKVVAQIDVVQVQADGSMFVDDDGEDLLLE